MYIQRKLINEDHSRLGMIDITIWILLVFLFSSFYIFGQYIWGKYLLALVSISVFCLTLIKNKGRFIISINAFHYFVFSFALYCLISALWALNSSDSITKFSTIIQILICYSLLYVCLGNELSVKYLLNVIMWGGYVISVYSFISYGGLGIVLSMLAGGTRLQNDFTNVNSIGLVAAFSCILQFHNNLYNKTSLSTFFVIPSLVMIIATQSRKALVLLVIGLIFVYALKNIGNKGFLRTTAKIISGILLVIIAIIVISNLPVFAGINKRMEGLLASVTGNGIVDRSTWLRQQFIHVGWHKFLQTPLGGIGIGCSHYLTVAYGTSTYLHNNYIELLACGGVLGFCLYYSIYAYLIIHLLKYRKLHRNVVDICLIILILLLIMDYGMVSFYSKSTYFYFMAFFLEIQSLKRRDRIEYNENIKPNKIRV